MEENHVKQFIPHFDNAIRIDSVSDLTFKLTGT